jgi:hypothetical protein
MSGRQQPGSQQSGSQQTGATKKAADADASSGLFDPNGAGEAIRTPDPNLGKVMLYP